MRSLRSLVLVIQKRYRPRLLVSNVIFIIQRVWLKLSVDKFSQTMEDGDVTEETRIMAYNMCRDSIGGVWATIPADQFVIQKLSGGLTNYLYTCSLPDQVRIPDNQPAKVLFRVYGAIAANVNIVVTNSVIFSLLSEKRLGPRLYGMTPLARIEEFLPYATMNTKDIQKPEISLAVARKLAKFHALDDMPLCKQPRFLFDKMDEWVDEVEGLLQKNSMLKTLYGPYMFGDERENLKDILRAVESPVVFAHNDLQEGNILYDEGSSNPEDSLTFIDWEYCSYSYRGHDIGNHFIEWTLNYCVEEAPYFSYTPENFPNRKQQYAFFRAYLEESGDEVTEQVLAAMYREVNTFVLSSHFLWCLWSIIQSDGSTIPFGFLEYATCRIKEYYRLKQRLAEFSC